MYEIINGILHQDGEAVFALGQSYYASYHPQKIPVLEEGDRFGEMDLDLQGMADAGYNLVRFATLGRVKREADGSISTDFPLADALVEKAEAAGIASMVRLQGYSINLSGYTDALMQDARGNDLPFFHWAFVQNCLNHPGVIEDNRQATVAAAAHFADSPIVGFQIYNEPAYPNADYDYNPHSIRAWRDWLVECGHRSAEEVAELDAPRQRPAGNEDGGDWILWNLFKQERLNHFLNDLSDKAKESVDLPTTTCLMPCPLMQSAAIRAEDYYGNAEGMDMLGITHYIPSHGPEYYNACAVLSLQECAAARYGKAPWLIEYNCKTALGAEEYERETYAAVGHGIKGIIYYQWRADYPFEGSPEPQEYGLLWNDRTPTEKFDRAVAMNRLMNELGSTFVAAERERSGVAILYSDYANAACDVVAVNHEPSVYGARQAYEKLHRAGVAVDFIRAEDLADDLFGVRLLILPCGKDFYSFEELKALEKAEARGVTVIEYSLIMNTFGWPDGLCGEALLRREGIAPLWQSDAPRLDAKVLRGKDKASFVISLVNTDSLNEPIPAGRTLTLNLPKSDGVNQAIFRTPRRNERLELFRSEQGIEITLPEITTGAFIQLN